MPPLAAMTTPLVAGEGQAVVARAWPGAINESLAGDFAAPTRRARASARPTNLIVVGVGGVSNRGGGNERGSHRLRNTV